MDYRLTCKIQSIKLPEDTTEENLDNLGFYDHFLDTTSKAQLMDEIIDKLDFVKI